MLKNFEVDAILKIGTVLIGIAYVVSFFHLYLYYSLNNIQIFKYISSTEIVFLFIPFLSPVTLIMVLLIALGGFNSSSIDIINKKRTIKFWFSSSMILIISILYIFLFITKDTKYIAMYNRIHFAWLYLVFIPMLIDYIAFNTLKIETKSLANVITIVSTLLAFNIYSSLENITYVHFLSKNYGTQYIKLILPDKIIETNSDTIYIGSNSKYYFFKVCNSENLIINAENAEAIVSKGNWPF